MANLTQRKNDPWLTRRPEDMFNALHREMNRLFGSFADPFGVFPASSQRSEWLAAEWYPFVNIEDREKEILVSVEVPGVDQKDIEVLTEPGSITIRGQKKQEHEEEKKNFYRFERSFGSFERTIPLPAEVDEEKAEANFKNGVLEITLPKSKKAIENLKKIPIKAQSETRSAQASTTKPAQAASEQQQEHAGHQETTG